MDRQAIETDREELTALIHQLKLAQQAAGVADTSSSFVSDPDLVDVWDDLAFELVPTDNEQVPIDVSASHKTSAIPQSRPNNTASLGPAPIEDYTIALPSNGNTNDLHRELELEHRIALSNRQLDQIRDLIAEKSFQFSHVIRVAPRKGVTTRSRAAVKKLNNKIAGHCRLYARCRSRLVTLGANISILSRLKVLTPSDVKASTAVLNPNEPGSTRVKLSWIWQTTSRHIYGLPEMFVPSAETHSENAEADFNITAGQTADEYATLIECR